MIFIILCCLLSITNIIQSSGHRSIRSDLSQESLSTIPAIIQSSDHRSIRSDLSQESLYTIPTSHEPIFNERNQPRSYQNIRMVYISNNNQNNNNQSAITENNNTYSISIPEDNNSEDNNSEDNNNNNNNNSHCFDACIKICGPITFAGALLTLILVELANYRA